MKASRFTDVQKAFIIRQSDDGPPVAEICRKAGSVRRPTTTDSSYEQVPSGARPASPKSVTLVTARNMKNSRSAPNASSMSSRSRPSLTASREDNARRSSHR
jgi:hypothetical protein